MDQGRRTYLGQSRFWSAWRAVATSSGVLDLCLRDEMLSTKVLERSPGFFNVDGRRVKTTGQSSIHAHDHTYPFP